MQEIATGPNKPEHIGLYSRYTAESRRVENSLFEPVSDTNLSAGLIE